MTDSKGAPLTVSMTAREYTAVFSCGCSAVVRCEVVDERMTINADPCPAHVDLAPIVHSSVKHHVEEFEDRLLMAAQAAGAAVEMRKADVAAD